MITGYLPKFNTCEMFEVFELSIYKLPGKHKNEQSHHSRFKIRVFL